MRWLSQVQNYTSNIWPSTLDFKLIFVTIVIVVCTTTESYSTKIFSVPAFFRLCLLVLPNKKTVSPWAQGNIQVQSIKLDPPEQCLSRYFYPTHSSQTNIVDYKRTLKIPLKFLISWKHTSLKKGIQISLGDRKNRTWSCRIHLPQVR